VRILGEFIIGAVVFGVPAGLAVGWIASSSIWSIYVIVIVAVLFETWRFTRRRVGTAPKRMEARR
jgi:uncharacterized membrane protein YraQ (UPF0718 family)